MTTLAGWIALSNGLRWGRITFGATIQQLELDGPSFDAASVDGSTDDAPRILPGFIDVHQHGGAGADVMDGPDAVRTAARHHLLRGVTTVLPTTLTNPWPQVLRALDGIRAARADAAAADRDADLLPDLLGAHLEGPFLSPGRLGAQPQHAIPATLERVDEVLARHVVRIVTLAPEIDGALEAAQAFARAGVRVSVGHTKASAEQVRELAELVRAAGGTVGFTHLYNAMGGMAGRAPGVVGACFADADAYAELILDGHHVADTSFLAARAAKPGHLLLVSDAMRAAGLPNGVSELGGQRVTVAAGRARLDDGTLAGSVASLDDELRRAVELGVPLAEASRMTSDTPSRYLGLTDRGRIEEGLRADLVVLDARLEVRDVYVAGRPAGTFGDGGEA